MRLVLALDPSALEFTEPGSGGAYPLLVDVGTMREGVRVGNSIGIAANESSSVEVTLDNRGKRAATIIDWPLRASAEIYDDNDELYFAGTVAVIAYNVNYVTLEIDA